MEGNQHGPGSEAVPDGTQQGADPAQGAQRPQGDPVQAIEQAVAGTSEVDTLPVAEHVARFEAVHGALSDALSSIDEV